MQQAFKRLHAAGERLEPRAIQVWAVRNGWWMRHAETLAEMAAKIDAGKPVKGTGGKGVWARGVVSHWRAKGGG